MKIKIKVLFFLLCLSLITILPFKANVKEVEATTYWTDYVASSYAGGNGTTSNPYLISTASQFTKMVVDSSNLNLSNYNFKLINNISFINHDWVAMTINTPDFNFDGNAFTLSNFYSKVLNDSEGRVGIFKVFRGTFQNTFFQDLYFNSTFASGFAIDVIGTLNNLIFNNVNLTGPQLGGLCYHMYNGYISNIAIRNMYFNSTAAGTLSPLVPWNDELIENCYVQGTSTGPTGTQQQVGNFKNVYTTFGSYHGTNTVSPTDLKSNCDTFFTNNFIQDEYIFNGYPVPRSMYHQGI